MFPIRVHHRSPVTLVRCRHLIQRYSTQNRTQAQQQQQQQQRSRTRPLSVNRIHDQPRTRSRPALCTYSTMPAKRMNPLVIGPTSAHTASVIFAHGLGDTGAGWAMPAELWGRSGKLDHVKFILPNALTIPVTVNMGMEMPGWFDVKVLDGNPDTFRDQEDVDGIKASQTYLHSLIQAELDAGIPADRIIVGGFSQGGVVGSLAGLTFEKKLAGIMLLSSWLPMIKTFKDVLPEPNVNQQTPIFIGHGADDRLVAPSLGKESVETLKAMGYGSVSWKMYPGMGHSTCNDELSDVLVYLASRLPST